MCLPVKPFKVEREWEAHGLKCAVVLAVEKGHRCGYVRVPVGHSDHGKGYDDVDVEVHGRLTFGKLEPCEHEDGQGYWLGFDCAHAEDLLYDPADPPSWVRSDYMETMLQFKCHYWTTDEVAAETERLAEQLAARGKC